MTDTMRDSHDSWLYAIACARAHIEAGRTLVGDELVRAADAIIARWLR